MGVNDTDTEPSLYSPDVDIQEDSSSTLPNAHTTVEKKKRASYLLQFLKSSDMFPNLFSGSEDDFLDPLGHLTSSVLPYSSTSSSTLKHSTSTVTGDSSSSSSSVSSEIKPFTTTSLSADKDISDVDVNNLPYRSPPVFPTPRNPNRFRTIVRDGPIGTLEGARERYVTIAKRSFRGAGLCNVTSSTRIARIYHKHDTEVRGSMNMDGAEDDEYRHLDAQEEEEEWMVLSRNAPDVTVEDEESDEDDEEDVEVMWSLTGEEFQLMRDPTNDGRIGRETSWINRQYFKDIKRKKKVTFLDMKNEGEIAGVKEATELRGRPRERVYERVELRMSMDTDQD